MISIILFIGFFCKQYCKLDNRYKEAFNYLVVGGLTTVVSIISYNLFRFVIDNYLTCTVLSWIVAVLFAYVMNRKFVFFSQEKRILREFFQFVFSRLLSLLAELAVMYILVDFLRVSDRLSKVIVQVIIIILNYIFSKLFVFKTKA